MATFTPTGHPDWQPVQSVPIPVLVGQLTNLNPGVWGPFTVNMSSAGSYLMAIEAINGADSAFADIQIGHFDPAGNLVHQDFFGAMPGGGGKANQISYGSPTIIRGNIYGSTIKIQGITAATAWINGVFTVGGFTATGVNINIYVLPSGLSDPEPRMFSGEVGFTGFSGFQPGSLLWSAESLAVAFSSNSGILAVAPYSGPVDFSYWQTGVAATPTNLRFNLDGYTVDNGTGAVLHKEFSTQFATVGFSDTLAFPTLMHTITVNNADGAQNATVNASLCAMASA